MNSPIVPKRRFARRFRLRAPAIAGGHGVGRTIHESPSVPNYADPAARHLLTEGLVITIEPIIAVATGSVSLDRDEWTVRTMDGSLSAHYEHTIVITRGHPILLTAA